MNKKELTISFNAPLNPQDTETQTFGCRANNPDICRNNSLHIFVLLLLMITFAENHQELGKNNIISLRVKPLNYCLPRKRRLFMTNADIFIDKYKHLKKLLVLHTI